MGLSVDYDSANTAEKNVTASNRTSNVPMVESNEALTATALDPELSSAIAAAVTIVNCHSIFIILLTFLYHFNSTFCIGHLITFDFLNDCCISGG